MPSLFVFSNKEVRLRLGVFTTRNDADQLSPSSHHCTTHLEPCCLRRSDAKCQESSSLVRLFRQKIRRGPHVQRGWEKQNKSLCRIWLALSSLYCEMESWFVKISAARSDCLLTSLSQAGDDVRTPGTAWAERGL